MRLPLPRCSVQYPSCGACGGETDHDGESIYCDDCGLDYGDGDDGTTATYRDEDATADGKAIRCDIDDCTAVLEPGERSTPPGPWTTDQAIEAALSQGWLIDIFTPGTDKCPDHARAAIERKPVSVLDPFDRMTVAEYHELITATLEAKDMEGTAHAIRLMCIYHPREAEELLALIDQVRS